MPPAWSMFVSVGTVVVRGGGNTEHNGGGAGGGVGAGCVLGDDAVVVIGCLS